MGQVIRNSFGRQSSLVHRWWRIPHIGIFEGFAAGFVLAESSACASEVIGCRPRCLIEVTGLVEHFPLFHVGAVIGLQPRQHIHEPLNCILLADDLALDLPPELDFFLGDVIEYDLLLDGVNDALE